MSKHPIVHIEISAKDRAADSQFYSDLFGWEVEQMPEMNYATFETGEGPGGGFSPVMDGNPPGTVLVYVGTDDIPATLEKAVSLGGSVVVPETPIPGMGTFAVFRDPTGNQIGLYRGTNGSN
jgi:predicted enzyme related to lactoylglutathione lyase